MIETAYIYLCMSRGTSGYQGVVWRFAPYDAANWWRTYADHNSEQWMKGADEIATDLMRDGVYPNEPMVSLHGIVPVIFRIDIALSPNILARLNHSHPDVERARTQNRRDGRQFRP